MRVLFITLISIIISFNGFLSQQAIAQDRHKLDSLWTTYKQAKHDTTRIKTFLDIGYQYEYIISDSVLFYYKKAVDLADKNLNRHPATFQNEDSVSIPQIQDALTLLKAKSLRYIGVVHYSQGDYDKAIKHYLKSLNIYKVLGNKNGMSECYNNIGIVHRNEGSYNIAIEHYLKSLKIYEEIKDKKGMSQCYNNIGAVHSYQGCYDKAIEYYFKSLKIKEELGDKNGISKCYTNIGVIHHNQGSYDKAIEYYSKSLKIKKELEDKKGMSNCLMNIGVIHMSQGSYDKAIEYYLKSLEIKEGLSDKNGMSQCYNNIGAGHSYQGNIATNPETSAAKYNKAIEYYLKSIKIKKELRDKNGIANVYCNIASLHIALAGSADILGMGTTAAHLDSTLEYGNKAYDLALEIGSVPLQNDVAAHLQKAYTKLGKYKEAIKYAEIYITTQDSMFSEEKTKALAEMGAKYEAEKKQLQIEKMEAQKELDNKTMEAQLAENKKQQLIIVSAIGGFIIVLVFSIIILRMFRQKRKANILLATQNDEIYQQKEEIESQRDEISAHRDKVQDQKEQIEALYNIAVARKELVEAQKEEIEDSIRYAKRIQTAVLPADKYADSILGEHFIIFRPHSVVSGDFYWATKTEEWTIVTAADCTGHGVPGAFMSMLGVSFLNEIVRKKDVTNTAEILNNLRTSVIDALKQTSEQGTHLTAEAVKDGMDMSIIAIHKDKTKALWAGANNPLYIARPKKQDPNPKTQEPDNKKDSWGLELETLGLEFKEYKGDSMPVAVHVKMNDFTNHEINLNKGDLLYLFTDGFPDQFGGPKGKKFKYKPFKRLLVENSSKPMIEQKEALESTLDKWMSYDPEGSGTGGTQYEQVDDITVVGIQI